MLEMETLNLKLIRATSVLVLPIQTDTLTLSESRRVYEILPILTDVRRA